MNIGKEFMKSNKGTLINKEVSIITLLFYIDEK